MKAVNRIIPFAILLWIILIAISLAFNLNSISKSVFKNARSQTSAFFEEIEIMRAWNANHGGVYVKIGENIYPNPYLDVPNRDLRIDSLDLDLTLVNPAYMTRLVANVAKESNKTQFHITSLNPIRPQNKADDWETAMLHSFEQGVKDTMELQQINGEMVYRYMRPLVVKQACLKCHSKQGYELGDIRGGIQVSIPATEYIISENSLKTNAWIIHIFIFILGLIGLVVYKKMVDRFIGTLMTANKEVEKQKLIAQKAYDKAELASHYKSLFLANMSHEIRTPLNGIIGFTSILKQGKLTDEQKEQLDVISISGENLLSLINDIIDYSKIEANQLTLENIPINLRQTIQETEKILKLKANEKGLDLSLIIHPELPKWISGDPTRIKQILINFTNNAIKFTDKGFVNINVYPVKKTRNRVTIKFDVVDTGIGISKENHNKLFKVFSQAEASTTRKFGGSGLGLAISKQLASMMGGEVGFTSALGEGSTFWFTGTFKLSQAPVYVEKKSRTDFSGLNLTILLVEDNIINQKVAIAHFSNIELEVSLANNGQEAVDMHKENNYDMIFMDIQMPIMDGYEATKEIRKSESSIKTRNKTVIIAMTANALKGEKEKCIGIGMNDYLAKPFKPEDLHDVIVKNT
ncbi:MAG: DUF3365 domain-containing protein [Bacteroidota bacterium]